MHSSLPGSSAHGLFQARIVEWVAISFSRGSSQPRDQTQASCIAGRFFTKTKAKPKPLNMFNYLHRYQRQKRKINLSVHICISEKSYNPKDPVITSYKIISLNVQTEYLQKLKILKILIPQ